MRFVSDNQFLLPPFNAVMTFFVLSGTEFVIRDCFNSTESDLPDDFHSCHDMMKAGNICYCGEENCNGQGHLIASGILATVATFTAYLVMS